MFLCSDPICLSDIRAEEEIVAFDTAAGIAILYLLVVVENGRLQRPAYRRSIMAIFHGFESKSNYFRTFIFLTQKLLVLSERILCKIHMYIICD